MPARAGARCRPGSASRSRTCGACGRCTASASTPTAWRAATGPGPRGTCWPPIGRTSRSRCARQTASRSSTRMPARSRGRRARGMAWQRRGCCATDGRGPGVAVRQPPGGPRGGDRAQHRTRVVRGGSARSSTPSAPRGRERRGARHVVDTAAGAHGQVPARPLDDHPRSTRSSGCPDRPHPPRRAVHRDACAGAALVPHRPGERLVAHWSAAIWPRPG